MRSTQTRLLVDDDDDDDGVLPTRFKSDWSVMQVVELLVYQAVNTTT